MTIKGVKKSDDHLFFLTFIFIPLRPRFSSAGDFPFSMVFSLGFLRRFSSYNFLRFLFSSNKSFLADLFLGIPFFWN